MFNEIGVRFSMSLAGVPCIGDSLRDLQAAAEVGGQPILVLTGKGEKTRSAGGLPENTLIFGDLNEAVRYVIGVRA
jgi:D-glycero-D-manno-heptose 1,7-bisphosphate phosphatase